MKKDLRIKTEPKEIFAEYEQGNDYKASLGDKGLFEQTKMNERFFVGDQWRGAQCGNDRPLTRYNVVKRIGEYKMSTIGSAPVSVQYTAEGIPNTAEIKKEAADIRQNMLSGDYSATGNPNPLEMSVVTDAMSSYFKVTSERLKLNIKNEQALRNAYISGTGIGYTYWDDSINTGLYADIGRTKAIKGDIAFEVIDVENVVFGDPNNDDVQSQPFILISQRLDVEAVRREAKKNGLPTGDILPDGATSYNSGDRGDAEPTDSRRVTVITKLFKEWDKNGDNYVVKAVKTTEKATVREVWDVGLTLYPIAMFHWERRRSSAYGDSEATYIIPNQIAINRMITSGIWSGLNQGMPKMIVNGDVVNEQVTNDPGQIIKVFGSADEVQHAISYVNPPAWASQYLGAINDLVSNTLSMSGANDAALGQIRPDNASAIIHAREAANQPMQIYQNRFFNYIEDIARIWADFWINKYGNRSLHIQTRNGDEYIAFNGDRYKNVPLVARVDVGASTLWGESVQISSLNGLLQAGIIDAKQYLERMPKGIIPKLTELIEDISGKMEAATEQSANTDQFLGGFAEQYPQEYAELMKKSPEEQEAMIRQIRGGMQG